MASHSAGCPVAPCGFLVIDKPAGITSHGCVAAVRRAYGLRKVGHGGTLDPAVTGVLPIAIGPATRLLPYLNGDKVYRAVVQLGLRTDSDDLEGQVLERCVPPSLTLDGLEQALAPFRGPIQQRPPAVSAVHVDGERAYARARRGEVLDLPPRTVTVHELHLLGWDGQQARVELEVRCSGGTYIRSLARDLGELLGCGAALARLRRTETLGFDLSTAVELERLASGPPPPLLDPLVALGHLERRQLLADELTGWRCGRALPLQADGPLPAVVAEAPASRCGAAAPQGPALVILHPDGSLAGIARLDPAGLLRPRLVLDAAG